MAYTQNVPQANQQIATTQPIIEANFQFMQTGVGQEHNFNPAGSGSDMYHTQASMPNKLVDPVALPMGTNGMYYVKGGVPKFYNGNAFEIQITQLFQFQTGGSILLDNVTPVTVFTMPANSCGYYFLVPPAPIAASSASIMGFVVSDTANLKIGAVANPGILITSVGLDLKAVTVNAAFNGTYKLALLYFTP